MGPDGCVAGCLCTYCMCVGLDLWQIRGMPVVEALMQMSLSRKQKGPPLVAKVITVRALHTVTVLPHFLSLSYVRRVHALCDCRLWLTCCCGPLNSLCVC